MKAPQTYRLRLFIYIGVLLMFMVAALVLSYRSSSGFVLKKAENSAEHLVKQIEGKLSYEANELAEYARMIRDNSVFAGYLYVASSLNTDPNAVDKIFQRQFGWLQTSRSVILSRTNKVIIGSKHTDLHAALRERGLEKNSEASQFFQNGQLGLELVVSSPMTYRSQSLGVLAITKALDADWLKATQKMSGGQLILVQDGAIVFSLMDAGNIGQAFLPSGDRVVISDEPFLVRRVDLGEDKRLPQLWFAMSQHELTEQLRAQRNIMLTLVIAGCMAGLLIGYMILKSFSVPLSRLVKFTEEVGAGRLPDIHYSQSRDEIGFLTNRFSEMVESLREQQEVVKRTQAQLEHEATTDTLTGFYNRRYLYNIFPKIRSQAMRSDKEQTLIIVDIDNFKKVNDKYGHQIGDQVLLHFARVLRDNSRESDFLFRLGGEEFLILTNSDNVGSMNLAEKIRVALEQQVYSNREYRIPATASFGVAQADDGEGPDSLSKMLQRADQALYEAKAGGRNRVQVWQPKRNTA